MSILSLTHPPNIAIPHQGAGGNFMKGPSPLTTWVICPYRGLPRTWPKSRGEITDFAIYGSWEGLDGCKMMPRGVGSFSTPGKPTSEKFMFCHFSERHFNFGSTFDFDGPIDLAW